MIKIYGKDNCPYCVKAVNLAELREYKYEYYKIGADIDVASFQKMFPNARTVPQIVIDGELIGGFDQFENWSLSESIGGMTL